MLAAGGSDLRRRPGSRAGVETDNSLLPLRLNKHPLSCEIERAEEGATNGSVSYERTLSLSH